MHVNELLTALKNSAFDFVGDNCPRLAAALAYYTAFSLPPLLVLVVMLLGNWLGPEQVQEQITEQTSQIVGAQGARQIETMLASARETGFDTAAGLMGFGALVFGASAVLEALQDALNTIWQVRPDPRLGGIRNFVVKRMMSFGMILGIAFLLLVSLIITTVISSLSRAASTNFDGDYWSTVFQIVNSIISIGVITFLFAAIYRYIPDAKVEWRDVWIGAGIAALLFTLGKLGLGLYLGRRDLSSVYGAAGSLALILIWVYYSSMILFYGSEFTQAWARIRGDRIKPEPGATRVVQKTVTGRAAERESRLENDVNPEPRHETILSESGAETGREESHERAWTEPHSR